MPAVPSFRWLPIAIALAVGACSSVDPKAGAQQDTCGTPTSAGSGTSSGPYGSMPMAMAMASAATCSSDAGDACDDCEDQWCCSAMQACYRDPVCFCSDGALDRCLEDAASDAAKVSACWQAFSAHGAAEATLATCLRTSCASACGVP
jgi:hypothetical protein